MAVRRPDFALLWRRVGLFCRGFDEIREHAPDHDHHRSRWRRGAEPPSGPVVVMIGRVFADYLETAAQEASGLRSTANPDLSTPLI